MSTRFLLFPILITFANAAIYPVAPPSQFNGPQSGIGSWFQTNQNSSHTNGDSWCGYAYSDDMPLFAPSLALMGGAVYPNPAWKPQTQEYCGREIKATNPSNGVSKILYIGDSFSKPRSAGSIDIVIDAFTDLYGSDPNGDHDDVMMPIDWEFTGNIDTAYTAPGAVFSTAAGATTPPEATSPPLASSTSPSLRGGQRAYAVCKWG
ncbi:hypothetical protein MMC21_008298 [Puttea exsequens]|nr:hypothetical protein [Puttea exsequens]